MTRVLGPLLAALAKRGVNLPDPDPKTHEFGSPVIIPARPFKVNVMRYDGHGRPVEAEAPLPLHTFDVEPCGKAGKPVQPDIAGFDKRADREARWRMQGCLELEKLVPFMKNAGVKPEIIEHAEEVLRDLQEARRLEYPSKGPE